MRNFTTQEEAKFDEMLLATRASRKSSEAINGSDPKNYAEAANLLSATFVKFNMYDYISFDIQLPHGPSCDGTHMITTTFHLSDKKMTFPSTLMIGFENGECIQGLDRLFFIMDKVHESIDLAHPESIAISKSEETIKLAKSKIEPRSSQSVKRAVFKRMLGELK